MDIRSLINAIFRFRGLVYAITLRELRGRYVGSAFGGLWLVLPTVFMVFIYTVVFSRIMNARLPGVEHQYAYSVYLCAGLVTWSLLLELVQKGKGVFLEHANLIKKASFPPFILFIPVVAVALFNSGVLITLVVLFMRVLGYSITSSVFLMIPALGAALFLGLVLGALLAVFNVFFRDIGQLTDLVFQALFWATPIVYPSAILPERVQTILAWNPLFSLINVSQNALLGEPCALSSLFYPLAVAAGLLIFLVTLYRRSYADLLDQI